jgi:hypothetical protein
LPDYLRITSRFLAVAHDSIVIGHMSNLIRMFSGRKKDATVWQWFAYDEVSAKSTCSAVTKDGNSCRVKLAGKNPTNMKVNLIKCPTLNRRKRDIWEKSKCCACAGCREFN